MAGESSGSENHHVDGPRHSNSRDDSGVSPRKRKRYSSAEEVFAKQSRQDIARISASYRQLQSQADETKTNLANATAEDLRNQLRKQNELFKDVKDTGLATMDARFLQTTTESAIGLVRQMKLDSSTFDIDDFLIRVKSILGLDRLERDEPTPVTEDELDEDVEGPTIRGGRAGTLGDWEKIGWMAAGMCRRVPGIEFMYGPLSVEYQKRTQGPRQKRNQLAPEVRPQDIDTQTNSKEVKDHTLSNVHRIGVLLERKDSNQEGINFFQFVVNLQDFGQTVENVFYASFLVREGKAGIRVADDGEILIYSAEPPDENQSARDETQLTKNQAVIELDVEVWEEAKRLYNITESTIPHRKSAKDGVMADNSWYS